MRSAVVGMAWYRPEDYDRLRGLCADGANMADTYEEWLQDAEATFKKLSNEGLVLVKSLITADEFLQWCQCRQRAMDATARTAYAADVAAEYVRSKAC